MGEPRVPEMQAGGPARAPFAPLPRMSAATRRALEREALRANDRYLHEVIEEHAFCPYARPGREAGETRRVVHLAETDSLEPLVDRMLEAAASRAVVTQVILPLVEVDHADFTALCAEVTALGHARRGGAPVLAVAALHPALPHGETPQTMIPLFRRAPDPTIQWVRLDGLASIYSGRGAEDVYVPEEQVHAYVAANPEPRASLYDRIASTNATAAHRLGVQKLAEHLAAIAADARGRYETVLRGDPGT